MHPYIEWLSKATVKELEEPATRAVQRAIREAHTAGISTVGSSSSGELIETLPDGSQRPFIAARKQQ